MANKTPIHTEYFLSGCNSFYLDLMRSKSNQLYIRLASGKDQGPYTSYFRMVVFEQDLNEFLSALCQLIQVYTSTKEQSKILRKP